MTIRGNRFRMQAIADIPASVALRPAALMLPAPALCLLGGLELLIRP